MENQLNKFDYSQVITAEDLRAILRELEYAYHIYPWYRPIIKWGTGISIGVIMGLLHWVLEGKGTIKNSTGELR